MMLVAYRIEFFYDMLNRVTGKIVVSPQRMVNVEYLKNEDEIILIENTLNDSYLDHVRVNSSQYDEYYDDISTNQ